MSAHYMDRIEERMPDLAAELTPVVARIEALKLREDTAVLVYQFGTMRGDTAGSIFDRTSNGDQVWAIVRGGRCVTMMFRRSTQPATCEALRVMAVKRIAKRSS